MKVKKAWRGSTAVALALSSAYLLQASQGAAFCRTRTCKPELELCVSDANECITTGEFLYWPNACVSFSVSEVGSPKRGISFSLAENLIGDALSRWLSVECSSGKQPSLKLNNFGPVSCQEHVYNQGGPNANAWTFTDAAWPHDPHELALTSVTYNYKTGEIFDVDVEINSALAKITISDTDVGADLASIVTHEAGHFLGLAHSENHQATMWESYTPGSTSMRELGTDDVAGICAAYPADRAVASATCEPRRGFTKVCTEELSSSGCSLALSTPPSRKQDRSLAVLAFALLALLGSRRTGSAQTARPFAALRPSALKSKIRVSAAS